MAARLDEFHKKQEHDRQKERRTLADFIRCLCLLNGFIITLRWCYIYSSLQKSHHRERFKCDYTRCMFTDTQKQRKHMDTEGGQKLLS